MLIDREFWQARCERLGLFPNEDDRRNYHSAWGSGAWEAVRIMLRREMILARHLDEHLRAGSYELRRAAAQATGLHMAALTDPSDASTDFQGLLGWRVRDLGIGEFGDPTLEGQMLADVVGRLGALPAEERGPSLVRASVGAEGIHRSGKADADRLGLIPGRG